METLKFIFDEECKHLKIDSGLAKKLNHYVINFIQKNEDHVNFFGGNLLGVHVVRFTETDKNRFFDEIMEVNDVALEERLRSNPNIQPEYRQVASDTLNLSCLWLTHAVMNSKHLSDSHRHEACINVLLILHFKLLTSLMSHYFKFPANKEIAEATYAQLNFKFSIKVYGSWIALLKARAEDIISKESIWHKAILTFDPDELPGKAVADIQGRIRDIFKNIYAVFDQVRVSGGRIITTKQVVSHDGEEILRDKTKSLQTYTRYTNSIVSDKNSFVREELTAVIEKLIHTMPPRLLLETLTWMSRNYGLGNSKEIEQVINDTIIHTFDFLSQNKAIIKNPNDLPNLLSKLKGVIMSSRSTDETIFSLREKTEKIVRQATGITNPSTLSSVRTGVLLYIVLRTFTMHYYTTNA